MLPLHCWCMIFTTGRKPVCRGHVAMSWYASSFYCVLSGQCGLGHKLDAGCEGYLGHYLCLHGADSGKCYRRVRSQCWSKASLPDSSAWCAHPPVFRLMSYPGPWELLAINVELAWSACRLKGIALLCHAQSTCPTLLAGFYTQPCLSISRLSSQNTYHVA